LQIKEENLELFPNLKKKILEQERKIFARFLKNPLGFLILGFLGFFEFDPEFPPLWYGAWHFILKQAW